MQQLFDLDLEPSHIAEEVQNYFSFHAMRKQQAVDTLKTNISKEVEQSKRLLETKGDEFQPVVKKQGDVFKTTNPLLVLFQQHIRRLKD